MTTDNDNDAANHKTRGCNDSHGGESLEDISKKGKESINNDDFVINSGFPALYIPDSGFSRPWLDGDEPVPLFPFSSFQHAVSCSHLSTLLEDCELVFTARTREAHESYSSGATFFVPCTMKPRCALEGLAMLIFRQHTKHLPQGLFRPECSGAEWWTLILDQDEDGEDEEGQDDEIGMHFDADYGLEEQMKNLMLHPRLSTVTYLTSVGVPTLVLDVKSPQPPLGHSMDTAVAELQGTVERGWLSSPSIGKHIAFDGRLLHGAPGAFFPAAVKEHVSKTQGITESESPSTLKRTKTEEHQEGRFSNKRITFLVNIWLNHCPLDAEILNQDVCDQMKTPWKIINERQHVEVNSLNGHVGKRQLGEEAVFQWRCPPHISTDDGDKCIIPDKIESIKLESTKEDPKQQEEDPNLMEEAIIGHHHVTFSLSSSIIERCKEVASHIGVDGSSVQLQFEQDSFQIIVGEECESEQDDDDSE